MSPPFGAFAISPALLAVVEELGHEQPTPIQVASIPVLLEGKDLIGQSKTGSGKTIAFALPILERLEVGRRELQALVLCPTRELCAQVTREVRKLGRKHQDLQVLAVSGGTPISPQTSSLKRGVHIVVGTPGRVLDHLSRGTLKLEKVAIVVLDEADRMLEMGFQQDMAKILKALPKPHQTALFSATFPDSIEALSRSHQRDAVRVTVEDEPGAAPEVRQVSFEVEPHQKLHALYWVLAKYQPESALIFCNLKATVSDLTHSLSSSGISADCLHGDLEQSVRDRAMAMFRNETVRVLVATDVAARGIDVAGLDLVINYDLPSQPEVYIHRIGRTGRAGKSGLSVSLATTRERHKLSAIAGLAGGTIEPERYPAGEGGTIAALAKKVAREAKMDTIQITGGRKDKVRPGDILGALTGETGSLEASDVGKIEVLDNFSYVAVAKRASQNAVTSINSGRIKGKRFRAYLIPRFQG